MAKEGTKDASLSPGIIPRPLTMLNTPFAMYVGMVYSYLPFLILPLYANLEKMDWQLLEAAEALGCRPWQAFYKIPLPLSRNGILAESMLVFIPAAGDFLTQALRGRAQWCRNGPVRSV